MEPAISHIADAGLAQEPEAMPEPVMEMVREEPVPAAPAQPPRHSHNLRPRKPKLVSHISVGKSLKMYGKKALVEMMRELQQMLDKEVWTPLDPKKLSKSQLRSAIRSSLFLKEKFFPSGEFDKLKGRLVAGGNMQDRALYGEEDLSSPTATTSTVFIVAAIAAREHRKVVTLDIGGAYLNAKLESEVIINIDPLLSQILTYLDCSLHDLLTDDGTLYLRLDKALYGCIEAAKLWYKHLRKTLEESYGFVVFNPMDICLCNKMVGGVQVTIVIHVDDLMVTSVSQALLDATILFIQEKYMKVTVHDEPVLPYVGMNFDFSVKGQVTVSMEGYVKDLIETYPDWSKKTASPASSALFTIDEEATLLSPGDKEILRSAVAKILYLAKRVRPELLTACIFLATRVSCPTEQDMGKLKLVLGYLHTEPDLSITLRPTGRMRVEAYIDASYAVHEDCKSHSGVLISLGGGGPIYMESSKQKLVSKSSTEAELIALSDGISQVIWTRELLLAQGYSDVGPAIVYQDNMSAMALAEKGRSTAKRTRHINIRYFFVKDRIESCEVEIVHLPTEEMIADILTKPLQGDLFKYLRARLLNLL